MFSVLPWGLEIQVGRWEAVWGCVGVCCGRGPTSDPSPAVLEECRSVRPERSLWFLPPLWPLVMLVVNRVGVGRPVPGTPHPPLPDLPGGPGTRLTCCSMSACCCWSKACSCGGDRICCICWGVSICGDIMATDTGTCEIRPRQPLTSAPPRGGCAPKPLPTAGQSSSAVSCLGSRSGSATC